MEPLHRSGMAIKGRYSASKWSFMVSYGPFELFLGHFWGNWAPQWAFLTREMVPWHCLGVLWLVPTLFHQFGSTRPAHGHKMAFLAIWSHFEGQWRPNCDECYALVMQWKLKSKVYFVLSFKLKHLIPFEKVKKYQNFATNIFQMRIFFGHLLPKNWIGCFHNIETQTREIRCF